MDAIILYIWSDDVIWTQDFYVCHTPVTAKCELPLCVEDCVLYQLCELVRTG